MRCSVDKSCWKYTGSAGAPGVSTILCKTSCLSSTQYWLDMFCAMLLECGDSRLRMQKICIKCDYYCGIVHVNYCVLLISCEYTYQHDLDVSWLSPLCVQLQLLEKSRYLIIIIHLQQQSEPKPWFKLVAESTNIPDQQTFLTTWNRC